MFDQKLKNNLKTLMGIGAKSYTIAAIYVYAVKKGKFAFMKDLDTVIDNFTNQLSAEERKELETDIEIMTQKKAQEIVNELNNVLTEEEKEQILPQLKSLL
jgi:hypothetical protein